jgi:protein-tyrosine phosphatase
MAPPFFVDCHSHVVPSGDDGASTVDEGRALCVGAARHGTRILFATPHVWPQLTLTEEREERVREHFAAVAAGAGLELRLGYELTPTAALLDEDPRRYELGGTGIVLMEVPFTGRIDLLLALAEHTESAGLLPVIAHPERTEAVLSEPQLVHALAERGWPLQVNATSILGRHGPAAEELGWQVLEDVPKALIASDGHRATRPPHLDEAYEAARRRLAEERARALVDGSLLGLAPLPVQRASRSLGRRWWCDAGGNSMSNTGP